MIQLAWNPVECEADIVRNGGPIQVDDGLEAAVIMSLFCDRRADADDDITETQDPRGWWADTYDELGGRIGSKLWMRLGRQLTNALIAQAKVDIEESLQWLLDDGVASSIRVTVERMGNDGMLVTIEIVKPDAKASPWLKTWAVRRGV